MGVSASTAGPYEGRRGQEYYAYQEAIEGPMARLNTRFFEPYIDKTDIVVDFGCGSGHILAGLQVSRKVGIEMNPVARTAAAKRGLEMVTRSSELDDGFADVVVSSHALEHVRSPYDELVGLRRLLRSGGRLVLLLPLDDWRTQKDLGPDPNHHLYAWTPLLISNLLGDAGFRLVSADVVSRAVPTRLGLWRLPRPLLGAAEYMWAVLRRRRQMLVVAEPQAI